MRLGWVIGFELLKLCLTYKLNPSSSLQISSTAQNPETEGLSNSQPDAQPQGLQNGGRVHPHLCAAAA